MDNKNITMFLSLGNCDMMTLLIFFFLRFYFWKELYKHALLSVTSVPRPTECLCTRIELVLQPRIVLLTLIDCNLFRGRNSGLGCVENSHKLRQRHVSHASMQASSSANTRVSAILWRSEGSVASQRQERERILITRTVGSQV